MLGSTTTKFEVATSSIAAIDLGSNSFHMVVGRLDHGEVRILDRLGEKVQLGAGLDAAGNLDEASQQRALNCLCRFRQRIRDLDAASVQIVGTNALRAAKNKKQFLRRAQDVMGFPIEIITGREEARLIYLGVCHTLAHDEGKRLIIDIGGGSTELIIGERFEPLELQSLHMGCVSYRDRFLSGKKLSEAAFKQAVTEASRELLSIKQRYRQLGWQSCVGSSGSIKSIVQALASLGYEDGLVTQERLKVLRKYVVSGKDLNELGIKKERVSIFPAGLVILTACFEILKIKELAYSHGALREGLLYDIVGRIRHEDVRERSVRAMQTRYGVDQLHAERVQTTVLHAYDQVSTAWGLEAPENAQLLRWASEVFEIGLAVSHSQYHKHGAYLLRHSDMSGFTNLTQTYLATLVRAHRRKLSQEVFLELDDADAERLKRLAILFRLAVILTAARKSAETTFTLRTKGKRICLRVGETWLKKHPLTEANLRNEQNYLAKQDIELRLE